MVVLNAGLRGMLMTRIWRAADHRRMPWKNGGGVTTEIAVSPEGAGLDDFDWRVSTALVASDGPFSAFPGIDRTLTILEGDGLILDIEGEQVELLPTSAPFSFAADRPTSARLVGGPVTDLNVMTRRGRLSHRVSRIDTGAGKGVRSDAPVRLFLCASGRASLAANGHRVDLGVMDMADLSGLYDVSVIEHSDAALFLIEIFASV